ncbi:MAG TPA: DUF3810 family protein [Vicinamibacterales bacterium]|nr:DUF3810 family protein [Vicinamibacterales bacterium]
MIRILVVAAAVVAALAPLPAALVERAFSRGVYPVLQRALTPAAAGLPVAVFDVVLLGAVLLTLVLLLRRRRMLNLLALGAGLWLAFLLTWGLHYRRQPLASRLDYDEARVRGARVAEIARTSVRELNRLHRTAHARPWPDGAAVPAALAPGFDRTARDLGFPPPVVAPPKRSLLDPYFRRAAIDGLTTPFVPEIVLASNLLPFERPVVFAHEWAHLAGFADEGEAEFLAWLVCVRGDAQMQYSGWLQLYPHLALALEEAERHRLARALGPGPSGDLARVAERMRAASAAVRSAASAAYDRFLKVNRVDEGIHSYGAVVKLVAGTRFGPDFTPVRRDAGR